MGTDVIRIMAHLWKARLKTTSALLLFLVLGNEIVDCHAKLVGAWQLRGKSDFERPHGGFSSIFRDTVMRPLRRTSAGDAMRSYLAQLRRRPKTHDFGAVPWTDPHAYATRPQEIQVKTIVPRKTSPYTVSQFQQTT